MTLTRKEILIAFANDQVVQIKVDGVWQDCNIYRYLDLINMREYRIKPATITVNGVECPAPITHGAIYENPEWFVVSVRVYKGIEKIMYFNAESDARQVFDALILPFKELK
jgi:hypothetical protein